MNLADGGCDPANGAPGVHDGLSTCHGGPGLKSAVLKHKYR